MSIAETDPERHVRMSDIQTIVTDEVRSSGRGHGPPDTLRDHAIGEALVAHAPVRVATALVAVMIQATLLYAMPGIGSVTRLVVATAAYVALVGLAAAHVHWRRGASPAFVTTALALDLAFVHVATAVSTSPQHFERALFGTGVVLNVANFYFGRRQAWRVVGMGLVGYLSLVAWALARELPVDAVEELWSLGLALIGTLLVVAQAQHNRSRLRTIVTLFERAERGDFSHTYDEAADQRHDAITRVGRAYNRVRSQLASMVLSDPLTGCLNRRGFEQALAREVARASRAGSELALLVVDLDHFKMVNDTYGHPAGDEVLRAVGRLLLQAARVGDMVARVGGEEFAILLPTTGAEGALHFASRLCDIVRGHPFPIGPGRAPLGLTTSIGVAAVAPRNSRDSGGEGVVLARHADTALYAAKRTGRDRARQWDADLETTPRAAGMHMTDEVIPLGLP